MPFLGISGLLTGIEFTATYPLASPVEMGDAISYEFFVVPYGDNFRTGLSFRKIKIWNLQLSFTL